MDNSFPYSLLEDASLFSNETLIRLKDIVDKYPVFSVARILYLKNLAVLNSPDLPAELKRLTIGIPDRRKLFLLIEDKLEGQSSITMAGEDERNDAFDLIDSFLSQQESEQPQNWNEMVLSSSVSSDYIFWSMSQTSEVNEPESGANKLKHYELIDSFIREDEERVGRRMIPEGSKENEEPGTIIAEPDFSRPQEDSFFTETLAQVYIKQKRYERALQIIEKLSLKYPEKNIYFADQIRFLEKLIINNKNIK